MLQEACLMRKFRAEAPDPYLGGQELERFSLEISPTRGHLAQSEDDFYYHDGSLGARGLNG